MAIRRAADERPVRTVRGSVRDDVAHSRVVVVEKEKSKRFRGLEVERLDLLMN